MISHFSLNSPLLNAAGCGLPRLAVLLALLSPWLLMAATKTWDGSSSGLWTVAANWTNGVAPINGDALIFPTGVTRLLTTNSAGGATNFSSIVISGDGYALRSPSLTITNGLTNSGPILSENTIFAPVRPGANSTWNVAVRSSLTLASNITVSSVTVTGLVNGTLVVDGAINGNANSAFEKNGNGSMQINGSATLGNLEVNDGTLTVNGQLSSDLTVASGATLNGGGAVPAFRCSGNVSPGTGTPGRLTVLGDVPQFNPGSTLQFNLSGITPATGYDQLSVIGPFNLGRVDLVVTMNFVPAGAPVFVIITNRGAGAFTTTFPGLPEGAFLTAGSELLQISYTGGTGNDVTLTRVPTPTGVTRTWDAGGSDFAATLWSNPTNWVGNVLPVSGDSLLFPAVAPRFSINNDLADGTVFDRITIENEAYALSGNDVILRGGVQAIQPTNVANVSLPVTFLSSGGQTVNVSQASAGLLFIPPVTLAGPVIKQGAGDLTFNVVRGNGALEVSAGELTLLDSNTFTGPITVRSNSVLKGNDSFAFGATTPGNHTSVESGGQVQVTSTGLSIPEPLQLAGTLVLANDSSWNGPITMSGTNPRIRSAVISNNVTLGGDWIFPTRGRVELNGPGGFVFSGNASGPERPLFFADTAPVIINGNLGVPIQMTGLTELRGTGEVGTITNLPSVSGRLIPGLGGNGTLTCSNLTLVPNNFLTYVAEIAGPTHGQLRARGVVGLGTGTRLQLAVTGPAPAGVPLVIIDNVGTNPVSGTFLALTNQALITTNGQTFRVRYDGGDGNDVTLTRVVLPTGVTRTWDGGGPNDLWTTSGNWGAGVAPSPGDKLRFPPGAARRTNQNDFPAGTVFDSIEVTGGRYELNGQRIGLLSGIRSAGGTGEGLFCSLPLTLVASITVSNLGPAALDLLDPIDLGTHTLTFGCSNFTTIRVQAAAHISGAGGLVKAGAGDVAFFGSNSFAGPVLVAQGEYTSTDNSLGSTNGGTTVLPGARLEVRGTNNTIREALTLGGRLVYLSASNTWAGPVQITGTNASIDAISSLLISGRITGAESNSTVTIGPFGTVFLTGFNDYFRTIVHSANLVVNSGQSGNEIVLIEGGTLSGTGTVGSVRNEATGGFVAPDSSVLNFGRLSVGTLTWTPEMTYRADVRGPGPGSGHDMLDVEGIVRLGGARLQLSNTMNIPFVVEIVIVDNDGNDAVIGTFADFAEGALITNGPAVFRLSYTGGDGNDVTLTTLGTEIRAGAVLSLPGGAKQISGSGFADLDHVLEATPVLLTPPAAIPWQPILTNTADSSGLYQFIDFGATNFPQRFYRVRRLTAE